MNGPVWLERPMVLAIHAELLDRFGGLNGVRDEGMLRSALDRPLNRFAYEEPAPDLPALAATYAAGIVSNHPFLDGNKRTGFVTAALFLEANGFRFTAPEEEAVERTLALAARAIGEDAYADWLRRSCEPRPAAQPD